MRGTAPLDLIAARTALDTGYLASLEAGRHVADEFVARLILKGGFKLEEQDVTRLILGVQLYDLGLREHDLRQLVIDIIQKRTPPQVREEVRRLYRSYASYRE